MQEVLGDFYTDRNGVAQLSSIAMATNQRPHSFHRNSFTPQIPTTVRGADALNRLASRRRRPVRANPRQTGVAQDRDFQNMLFGCLCVCHSRFQNEVIGG
ncbi:MAG: hypothetical protein NT042_07330 [Sulfuritalea sp.]|nr:hypothetical protein [Sulfuritalea sp.]